MENSKMMLERQNKELKAKLEEAENSNRAKAKAAIGMLYLFLEFPDVFILFLLWCTDSSLRTIILERR